MRRLKNPAQSRKCTPDDFNAIAGLPRQAIDILIRESMLMIMDGIDGFLGHYGRLAAETDQPIDTEGRSDWCKIVDADGQLHEKIPREQRFLNFLPALTPIS